MIDWTEGCVAVTNREIEWLYKAVEGRDAGGDTRVRRGYRARDQDP